MKLRKAEIAAVAAAALVIVFTAGYFLGRGNAETEINVSIGQDSAERGNAGMSNKIDINSAGSEELMSLPGIGEVTAGRIIEYRTENGPFLRIEDIVNVSGIGDGTYMEIKDYITVDGDG